jgi:hypothetical protein
MRMILTLSALQKINPQILPHQSYYHHIHLTFAILAPPDYAKDLRKKEPLMRSPLII